MKKCKKKEPPHSYPQLRGLRYFFFVLAQRAGFTLWMRRRQARNRTDQCKNIFWSPVPCRWRCSIFAQAWMVCERSSYFGSFLARTRFACCRPDSSQVLMGRREQPIFAIVPNLVLVQLFGQFPERLLPSSRSRNVPILDPSHPHWIHVEGASQRSVASDSLRPSSPASSVACTTPTKSLTKYDQVLPTQAVLLSEPVGHQSLRFHQPDAWPRIGLTAEGV